MAVDLTPTFHVTLYLLAFESMLFFAVIMQTKSVEPGAHSGIARYFGLVFLFQGLAALFTAFTEQSFDGFFSIYFSILSVVTVFLAIALCIPAAVAVAVPEPNHTIFRAVAFASFAVLIVLTTLLLGPRLAAAPDLPYVESTIRHDIFAAAIAAAAVLAIACAVRMARRMKGRNGAFILLTALTLVALFAIIWAKLEPLCSTTSVSDEWPASCPISQNFDHNFLMIVDIMISNVLAAEGVLRLMASGNGVDEYVDINEDVDFIPVVET